MDMGFRSLLNRLGGEEAAAALPDTRRGGDPVRPQGL
jgi:hypothetical protein